MRLLSSVTLALLLLLGTGCSGNPLEDETTGDLSSGGEASEPVAQESAASATAPKSTAVSGGRDTVRETLVVVQALSVGPIRDEVVVSAKVESRTEITVFPRLSNLPVTSVRVDEGENVAVGDVLMTLYDTDLMLAEAMALNRLKESQAEVDRAKHKLDEAGMRIARAERQSAKTAEDLARREMLMGDGLVNVQEVEDLRLAAATALDDLELERFSLADLALARDLASIRAQQAELDWKQAGTNLSHTSLQAPASGVIASRDVDVGELSSMSAPAFRVVDLTELVLNLRVPQDSLARLAAGQPVELRSVTDKSQRFGGTVRVVNPVLDAATGTVRVIVDLEPAPGLVPGLFCEARIITAARAEALLVDKRAVLYEDDQPVFFALGKDGDAVRKVAFRAGASTPNAIEVLAAMDGAAVDRGLRVVVVGQESLKDGARVKVRETAY